MRKRIQQAGLIVACIAIWAAVLLYYWVCLRQLEPEKMAKDVTADLVEKDNLLTKIKHDSVLLSAVFQGKVNSRQQEYLLQQPVYIYAYNNDSLVFWNNNSVLPTAPWDSLLNKTIIKEKSKGVFVRKSFEFVSKTGHNGDGHTKHIIVAYLPVKIVYPVSNGYLSNHFLAEIRE
ncbi:MAG: hypothetical protein EBX41_06405 [Chitinophagia bacterium]|nr:hypothetical protein [Chitinophagia bacterium]